MKILILAILLLNFLNAISYIEIKDKNSKQIEKTIELDYNDKTKEKKLNLEKEIIRLNNEIIKLKAIKKDIISLQNKQNYINKRINELENELYNKQEKDKDLKKQLAEISKLATYAFIILAIIIALIFINKKRKHKHELAEY